MKPTALALAAAAALTLSSGAFAQAYVGAAAGQSHYNLDCTGTITCDRTDTGFKVYGGFKFTPNWAAEVNYFDFGKAKATMSDGQGGTASASVKATGPGLGVAFFAPMSPNWQFVGRLGAARMKTTIDISAGGGSGSDSDTHTKAYYGLGVSYLLPLASKSLSIDAAVDWTKAEYTKGGLLDLGTATVRLISVGVSYTF